MSVGVPSVAFFGIGGSDKKSKVSEGVVHDSKKEADDSSDDILAEFEAQFSNEGPAPVPSDPVPGTVQASPSQAKASQPSPSQSSSASEDPSFRPPSAPSAAREPSAPIDFTAPSTPEQNAPPQPREPQPQMSSGREQQRAEPWGEHPPTPNDADLPDFDFDFHPSPDETQAPPAPRQPQRAPTPPPTTPSAPPQREWPPQTNQPPRPSPDLPDFNLPPPTAQPSQPSWLDNAPQSTPSQSEPHKTPEYSPIIMRDGALFIEKHALAKHLSDLGDLRDLSHSTSAAFGRVESLAHDEKKSFSKMQTTIKALQDSLEESDRLLFSGD